MAYNNKLRNDIAKRLKEAREKAGYSSIDSFCAANKLSKLDYLNHELGKKPLKLSLAKTYAKLLNISLQWLVTGIDT